MRRLLFPVLMWLASCMPAATPETASRAAASLGDLGPLPAMKRFVQAHPTPPTISNADLARDVLDLAFALESGRALEQFSRFEAPVTVSVQGKAPPSMGPDLDRLLARLRREAGIDISRVGGGEAGITLVAVPRDEIRRHLPQAACFVVPNVSSLQDYLSARNSRRVSWTSVTRRERVAIFLPADAAPQELRDCLHEEIAQALGPLNDLYRLGDSVFNDDNVHTVLTGYDMTVLRVFYDPALRSGMRRDEIAARLPSILARVNPEGSLHQARRLPPTPRDWSAAVQTALGPGTDYDARLRAASSALGIAEREGWRDHRLGFSHYAMGRLLQGSDAEAARRAFLRARDAFEHAPDTALHQAYVAAQLAAYEIHANRPEAALALTAPHLDTAMRHENAALLSTLLLLRSEALDLAGRASESQLVKLDSLGWARYGFGPDWAVRAKAREIGSLNPLKGGRGAG